MHKKSLIFIFTLLSMNLLSGQFDPTQYFSAQGDAILKVEPDQVLITLGVDNRGKDLVLTKEENYKNVSKAIEYCRSKGVEDKHIQTDYVSINPRYNYREDNMTVEYYQVSQSFTICLVDPKMYEALMTDLLQMGINRLGGVQFRSSKMEEHRYTVRKMAIEAAKQKAKFMSNEVGIELGDIINVAENVNTPYPQFNRGNYANMMRADESAGGGDGGSLSVGQISLKANVTIYYELIK